MAKVSPIGIMPVPATSAEDLRPASMLMVKTSIVRHTMMIASRKRFMLTARTLLITNLLDVCFLYTIVSPPSVVFLTVCIITEHMFDVKHFGEIFLKLPYAVFHLIRITPAIIKRTPKIFMGVKAIFSLPRIPNASISAATRSCEIKMTEIAVVGFRL